MSKYFDELTCKICGQKFENRRKYIAHITKVEKVRLKDYLLRYYENDCKCPYCGREKIWVRQYFGNTCGCNECVTISRKKTMVEKYGYDSALYGEKYKRTIQKKYGCQNYVESDDFKKKSKMTKILKYGHPNFVDREKYKQTSIEKYGVENYTQSDEWKTKCVSACMERFGVDYYVQSEEIRAFRFKNYYYDSIIFNSNDEILFYKFCKENKLKIECHTNEFFEYSDKNGKKHLYFPDFKINDMFIEIKGDHFFNENGVLYNPYTDSDEIQNIYEEKGRCMKEHNVIVIKSSEVRDYNKLKRILENNKLLN